MTETTKGLGRRIRSYSSKVRDADLTDDGRESVQLRYEPALEGLRAALLLAVVLAHSGEYLHRFAWFHITGFGSLTMFFVLSGFLVAAIILKNVEQHDSLMFGSFMWRRIKRLGAPLILFSIVYFLINWAEGDRLFTAHDGFVFGLVPTVATIVTYTNNFVPSFGYLQHFDSVQMWSLGVDMQMYLVLPLLLALFLWRTRNIWTMCKILVGMTLVVQVTRYLEFRHIWEGGSTIHTVTGAVRFGAVYQRPENSLDAFLVGIVLCLLWKKRLLPSRLSQRLWIPASLVFMLCLVFMKIRSPWPYVGGYALVILCSFFIVAEMLREGSVLRKMFGSYPLRLVGRFSYTIYIWHLLVFASINRWLPSGFDGMVKVLTAWLALACVSVAAWWIAERPLMRLPPLRQSASTVT